MLFILYAATFYLLKKQEGTAGFSIWSCSICKGAEQPQQLRKQQQPRAAGIAMCGECWSPAEERSHTHLPHIREDEPCWRAAGGREVKGSRQWVSWKVLSFGGPGVVWLVGEWQLGFLCKGNVMVRCSWWQRGLFFGSELWCLQGWLHRVQWLWQSSGNGGNPCSSMSRMLGTGLLSVD